VAQSLVRRSARVDLVPEESYFLKPLTDLLAQKLGPRH
jgi:hypothetical protein